MLERRLNKRDSQTVMIVMMREVVTNLTKVLTGQCQILCQCCNAIFVDI